MDNSQETIVDPNVEQDEGKGKEQSPARKRLEKFLKVILFAVLLLIVAAIPLVIYGYNYANDVLDSFSAQKALSSSFASNSFIYEDNGDLLFEVHGEINRTPVSISKVPLHVRRAFVAIEDERYYKHRGVDLKAIIRASVDYAKKREISQGGSTITQQVIRMYFLTPEQTVQRKVREVVIALEFERHFDKDAILELYLNRVYFGEGAYGIQSASKVYFNKNAEDLSLEEGALLAALVQAPSRYDPYYNSEGVQWRRDTVLNKMNEQGFITNQQRVVAQGKPIELESAASMGNYNSFFVDYIMDEAIEVVSNDSFFEGGLRIYTTYEPEIQKKVEEVCARGELFPSDQLEVAVAMVENGTGEIKALIGGRQYLVTRGLNRATQLTRQPGSAFKPIAVYVPAFEMGYSPDSIIYDTPFVQAGYEPKNSGGGFYGAVSIRTAVQWSRNVAAVRLLNQIGINEGYDMSQKLGFSLVEDDRCLPLALGGLTNGVTPLQMAGAYSTFANEGVYIKPYTIKRIEDSDGKVIYEHPLGMAVMKASSAANITDVLRVVVNSGTGTMARLRGVQVAGKTGTTELPNTPEYRGINGNKDAWFVGYTEEYTVAVWLGFDEVNMSRRNYLTSYGGNQPAEIFRLTMASVLDIDSGRAGAIPYFDAVSDSSDGGGQRTTPKSNPAIPGTKITNQSETEIETKTETKIETETVTKTETVTETETETVTETETEKETEPAKETEEE